MTEQKIIAIRTAAVEKNIDLLAELLTAFRKENPHFNAHMTGALIDHVGYIVFGSQGCTILANKSMTQTRDLAA